MMDYSLAHTNTHTAFHFTRCSLMAWSHVDHCDVLIRCLDSHSDGTHLLCRRSIGEQVMLHFFKSVTCKKYTSTSWVAWRWVHFSFYFVYFWGNVLNGIVDFTWYSDCYYHYPIKLFPPKLKCNNGGSIVCPECISTVEIFHRFVSCLLVCDPKVLVNPLLVLDPSTLPALFCTSKPSQLLSMLFCIYFYSLIELQHPEDELILMLYLYLMHSFCGKTHSFMLLANIPFSKNSAFCVYSG